MAVADTINATIGPGLAMSGCAAMNTPSNPNVHLLLQVREWLASQGHSPDAKYRVIIELADAREQLAMLTLLPASIPATPSLRPTQSRDGFWPTPAQAKFIRYLADGPKLPKQCKEYMGGSLYGRNGVLLPLMDLNVIEKTPDGKYGLTEIVGEGVAEDVRDFEE